MTDDNDNQVDEVVETEDKKPRKRRSAYKSETQTMSVGDAIEQANSARQELAEEMRSWCDNMEEKFSSTSRFETASTAAGTLEGIDEVDYGQLDYDSQGQEVSVTVSVAARRGRGESRATRAGNAAAMYAAAVDALNARAEELRERMEQIGIARKEPDECSACKGTGDMNETTADVVVPKDALLGVERKGWSCDACGHFHAHKEVDGVEDIDEADCDELESWADACESCASDCEQAQSEIEGVEFPGMYG